MQRLSGDPAAALVSYQKALAYDSAIVSETPDSTAARLALSFSNRGVGEALNGLTRYSGALDSFAEAIKIQDAIRNADPTNVFAADSLFESHLGVAIAYRGQGRLAESVSSFQKAFAIDAAIKRDKQDDIRKLVVAKARLEFAQTLLALGSRSAAARTELSTALAVFEETSARGALDPAFIADYEKTKQLLAST